MNEASTISGRAAALWGIGGVCALLVFAIVRLTSIGLDSFNYDYHWYHWLVLIANVTFMAYSEGYKGFQKAYSPRLAARVRHLSRHPTLLRGLLAPLFGMGFFHTTRVRLVTSYVLTIMIVVFVYVAHQLPQPWRGILDLGVVVGLSWGLVSILAFGWQALCGDEFSYSPELPGVTTTA